MFVPPIAEHKHLPFFNLHRIGPSGWLWPSMRQMIADMVHRIRPSSWLWPSMRRKENGHSPSHKSIKLTVPLLGLACWSCFSRKWFNYFSTYVLLVTKGDLLVPHRVKWSGMYLPPPFRLSCNWLLLHMCVLPRLIRTHRDRLPT
jgi:hypothetical protein